MALVKTISISILKGKTWFEIFSVPIENPKDLSDDDVTQIIDELKNLFYKTDKLQLNSRFNAMVIRNLDKEHVIYKFEAK